MKLIELAFYAMQRLVVFIAVTYILVTTMITIIKLLGQ